MSAKIKLTKNQYAIVDDEDFVWLNKNKWHCTYYGYAAISNGSRFLMHRLIMNAPKTMDIDHINRNRLDNRKQNLRLCFRFQNRINEAKRSHKQFSSKYKGVFWNKINKNWRVRISYKGKAIEVGSFINEVEAANAYNRKIKKVYGEFAFVNQL